MNLCTDEYLTPDWPAPANVRAFTTTRQLGNLVEEINRQKLRQTLNLPEEPVWLTQVHGDLAVDASTTQRLTKADASYTAKPNQVCAILTADCLPILLCDRKGTKVAAIHAGWRGIAGGVIENTVQQLKVDANQLLAWLGPAIGPENYLVREDMYQQVISKDKQAIKAFTVVNETQWSANLALLATLRLQSLGITKIYGGNHCTASNPELFYSFRREGEKSGRMATIIWLF